MRIWSAGCSTGEEPYTLAMILHEVLKSEIGMWDIKITANDLSEAVLKAARQGRYNEYALRTTPKDIISKYFIKKDWPCQCRKHRLARGWVTISCFSKDRKKSKSIAGRKTPRAGF